MKNHGHLRDLEGNENEKAKSAVIAAETGEVEGELRKWQSRRQR